MQPGVKPPGKPGSATEINYEFDDDAFYGVEDDAHYFVESQADDEYDHAYGFKEAKRNKGLDHNHVDISHPAIN